MLCTTGPSTVTSCPSESSDVRLRMEALSTGALEKTDSFGKDSLVWCIDEMEVPGVKTDPWVECDIVLIVVVVLESVMVAVLSLRLTTGECGAECAKA